MINFILLTIIFCESVALSVLTALMYRKNPFEPAAKSLFGLGVATAIAFIMLQIHTAFFSDYYPPVIDLTQTLWLKIPVRVMSTGAALLVIYCGLETTTWLTRSHFDTLKRSRYILSGQLLIALICSTLTEFVETDLTFYFYAATFVGVCTVYGAKIIYWFHVHAKSADAVRKWQLRLSEIACLLLVLGPTDLFWDWEKLIFRPNLLLYIIGYALIIIVGTKPQWFQNTASAIENAPYLIQQNLALLGMLAEQNPNNFTPQALPWLNKLTQALNLSPPIAHSIARAMYTKSLVESNQLSEFSIQMLSSPDIDEILEHTNSRWDGHQSALSENAIPLESRILSLVEAFVIEGKRTNDTVAINRIKKEAGKRFDPQLVEKLEELVEHQSEET
jgi:hypothetical protein